MKNLLIIGAVGLIGYAGYRYLMNRKMASGAAAPLRYPPPPVPSTSITTPSINNYSDPYNAYNKIDAAIRNTRGI